MTITDPTVRDQIPTLLDHHRPDRYDPTDKSWQEPVVDMVASEIDELEARQLAAERIVSLAEAAATRRTNKLLREISQEGAYPLDWLTAHAWPLAVGESERVALRAATAADYRRFAQRERRAAANDFAARNDACEGAEKMADLLDEHSVGCTADLFDQEVAS